MYIRVIVWTYEWVIVLLFYFYKILQGVCVIVIQAFEHVYLSISCLLLSSVSFLIFLVYRASVQGLVYRVRHFPKKSFVALSIVIFSKSNRILPARPALPQIVPGYRSGRGPPSARSPETAAEINLGQTRCSRSPMFRILLLFRYHFLSHPQDHRPIHV